MKGPLRDVAALPGVRHFCRIASGYEARRISAGSVGESASAGGAHRAGPFGTSRPLFDRVPSWATRLTTFRAFGSMSITRQKRQALLMPAGGTDLLDILLYALAGAALIIVLGGGAFQTWRHWSDRRKIRKHLRH